MTVIQSRSMDYAQNFLKSRSLVERILDRCNIGADDVVYEIGPGKGIITECLVQRCRRVVAIEKDPVLARVLHFRYASRANIQIHEGDFLDYPLPYRHYKVFANIPFNITSAIVTRLTTAPVPPDDIYLIMQKEAAQKFLGEPHESLYSVLLKPCFALEILHRFRRNDFAPDPRVDVVMLRLCKRGPPLLPYSDLPLFRDFVVYCFTSQHPSLRRSLKGIFTPRQFKFLNLDCNATPTTLCFEQWLALFDGFKRFAQPQGISMIQGSERRLRQRQGRLEKIHRTRVVGKR